MGLKYRVKKHKSKLNKDYNDDTFRPIKKTVTPEYHRSIT